MKTIFILYMSGHAGNLINRLISLSPETVPQVPLNQLQDSVLNTGQAPEYINRLDWYSFNKSNDYKNWQMFHRDYPDFYNRELFDCFSEYFDKKPTHIVYAIHPHEFHLLKSEVDARQDSIFYNVTLSKKYTLWLEHYRQKLGFNDRENEIVLYEKFTKEYNMQPISLDAILDSPQSFEEEYLKLIHNIGLTPELEQARTLYAEWLELRGPNNVKI